MNAIKLLTTQHRQVEAFFKKYKASDDNNEKLDIFTELADNIAAHSTIEEKLFYPAVYVGKLSELLHEAVEEHLAAKRIIADLLQLSPSHEEYDAKMKVLEEQIEHHVEEEEEKLLPKVEQTLKAPELEALGQKMEHLFETLMKQDPRQDVPQETDEAAPLPQEARFVKT
ncbi:MAG: hemerythrin domain-containing protein [Myxococcaceae bacterium]|nr:hemerythrin domain-containing protein [Myxococcaceae bacterium]